jgi:hypothetical protein
MHYLQMTTRFSQNSLIASIDKECKPVFDAGVPLFKWHLRLKIKMGLNKAIPHAIFARENGTYGPLQIKGLDKG